MLLQTDVFKLRTTYLEFTPLQVSTAPLIDSFRSKFKSLLFSIAFDAHPQPNPAPLSRFTNIVCSTNEDLIDSLIYLHDMDFQLLSTVYYLLTLHRKSCDLCKMVILDSYDSTLTSHCESTSYTIHNAKYR
jgi:hypothetical protein